VILIFYEIVSNLLEIKNAPSRPFSIPSDLILICVRHIMLRRATLLPETVTTLAGGGGRTPTLK